MVTGHSLTKWEGWGGGRKPSASDAGSSNPLPRLRKQAEYKWYNLSSYQCANDSLPTYCESSIARISAIWVVEGVGAIRKVSGSNPSSWANGWPHRVICVARRICATECSGNVESLLARLLRLQVSGKNPLALAKRSHGERSISFKKTIPTMSDSLSSQEILEHFQTSVSWELENEIKVARHLLTPKQQNFCDEYLNCGNATEAARRSGFGEKSPKMAGCNLLKNPRVKRFLELMAQRKQERVSRMEDKILLETMSLAFSNIKDVCSWDEEGKMVVKPSIDLLRSATASVESISSYEGNIGIKMNSSGKIRALENLIRMSGMGQELNMALRTLELHGIKLRMGGDGRWQIEEANTAHFLPSPEEEDGVEE